MAHIQQTPEDDDAELHLRALMPWLHDRDHPEFADISPTRAGVLTHTDQAAEEADEKIADLFGAPNGAVALSDRARTYISGLVGNGGRSNPPQITRGERFRRAIVEADHGQVVKERFSQFWKDLCFFAS